MKALSCLLALALCACGPSEPAKNPRFDPKNASALPERTPRLSGPPGLPSVVIAEIANEDAEVYFARNGADGLLLNRRYERWLTGPIRVDQGDQAVPEDAARLKNVGQAPKTRAPLALAGVGKGFLLSWVAPSPGGDAVWALALDRHGAAAGEAAMVAEQQGRISWIGVLPNAREERAAIVWESDTSGKQVSVATWERGRAGRAVAAASQLSGWHACTSARGVAVAWVEGDDPAHGKARLVEVAWDGRKSEPATLSQSARADVQVVALRDGYYAAWTDERDGDPHVMLSRLAFGGKPLGAPAPAVRPVGEQALVALVASEDHARALLAWDGAPSNDALRQLELTLIEPDRAVVPRARLSFVGTSEAPLFVPDEGGFATLTLAPARAADRDEAEPPVAPTFVRFDEQLAVRAAEPVRVAELAQQSVGLEGVPHSVYGLHCAEGLCSLLARGAGAPALLSLVTLPIRKSHWRAPARTRPAEAPPLARALSTLADVPGQIADVSAATLADGRQLVAWVTHHTGERDGPAPPGATLAYRFVDGDAPGPIVELSTRAISIGGVKVVALPAADKKDAVAVLGWAGPNAGSSQVFLTKIGADGSKVGQKTLTQQRRQNDGKGPPNEVYDVDLALTDKGNVVVVWADTRDGNAEIYAARADHNLQRKGREVRVTDTKGASMEPAVLVMGERILIAYGDNIDGARASDIHLVTLDGGLEVQGAPRRLHDSPNHSRTPQWAGRRPGQLALSWIDEPNSDGEGGARLLAIDDQGASRSGARALTIAGLPGVQLTSASVDCEETCRGVVAGAHGNTLRVGAFSTQRQGGAPVAAKLVATLSSGSLQDAGLSAVSGVGAAFFLHDRTGGVRVRRLRIDW